MNLGIVQSSPIFGEIAGNLSDCLSHMSQHTADLWVLPELFATGYQFLNATEARELAEQVPSGRTTQALSAYAAENNCFIVAGLPEIDGDKVYNSSVLVGPDGFLARYRKVHLFYEEKINFTPGNLPFAVVDIGIAKLGMMICFDHLFPESARSLALQGAEIICHPANLVLPDLAQRTMAIRALENGVFTATANRVGTEARGNESLTYTGQSQVIGPNGDPLVRLSLEGTEVAVVDLDVSLARDKFITKHNDKLGDRRPAMYHLQNQ
ncbi:acyltransferase [Candidatus Bipolaricaulota bacterium]|nr:acyltransferase [Candidatus Bipolaricaulota bacterium]